MRYQILLIGLLIPALAGCFGTKTNTVAVSGKVTYQGSPVEGAEVALIPADPRSEAKAARGNTNAAGEFTVSTYFSPQVDAAGARPGDYVVTVKKYEAPAGMTLEEWQVAQMEGRPNVPPLRHLVPEKYNNAKNSGLSVTVEKGGDNHFVVELVD